ncbi:MAG: ABC transporter permease [Terriglobales bacterium]
MPEWKEEVRQRLATLKLDPMRENELAEEIAQHLQDRYDELVSGGAEPDEAHRSTLEDWSAQELTEALRKREPKYHEPMVIGAASGSHLLADLWQDILYGTRLLRLNPGFAAIAILSLTLGIGANTTIFQLLDSIRLTALPLKHPEELAEVRIIQPHGRTGDFSAPHANLTNPQWEQIRAQQQGFSGMFAWSEDRFNVAPSGETHNVDGLYVSGDFFRVLGVQPVVGRLFTSEDDQRGCGSPGVVLSNAFWRREYGGEASAIGRKMTIEHHPFEIIGVTPASFYGLEVGKQFDVAVPLCADPLIRGEYARLDVAHGWWLSVMGRMKPGWTIERATAQLAAASPGIFEATRITTFGAEEEKHYLTFHLGVLPAGTGVSDMRRDYETPLDLLLAIAGFVLLIACANLASLMLARASSRAREIAIRLALGASRGRLVRQLMAESFLVAATGAGLGLLLSRVLGGFLVSLISTERNRAFLDLAPDWRVLGFTLGLAVLTCFLFGLAPALRATGAGPSEALKAGVRGNTAGRERFGLRRTLVTVQVALSLVLMVGALLFSRTLGKLLSVDPGFRANGILITDLDLTQLKLAPDRRQPFKRELLEQVRSIPGVDAAAATGIVPLSGNMSNNDIWMDGQDSKQKKTVSRSWISPNYFKTMETPLLAGRDFDERDTASSPKVAIVNRAFARVMTKGANPIGMSLHSPVGPHHPEFIVQIVGLVKDTKYNDLRDENIPIAYIPIAQAENPDEFDNFMIRSRAPVGDTIAAVKRRLAEVNPEISLTFHVFESDIREGLLRERLMATLSGLFGLLATVLAVIGLYGVMSYMVQQRTNEVGIRMALGAGRLRILGMILLEALLLLAVGIGVGLALSLALGKTASSLLFGVKPADPVTLGLAVALLAIVAAVASYFPARRASKFDPMTALRYE